MFEYRKYEEKNRLVSKITFYAWITFGLLLLSFCSLFLSTSTGRLVQIVPRVAEMSESLLIFGIVTFCAGIASFVIGFYRIVVKEIL